MFKDLYKKANDKIPTEDAYLHVMEKVNAKPQKTKYPYGKIAALAACFILTVSLISVYEKAAPEKEEFGPVTIENLPTPSAELGGTQVAQNTVKPNEQGGATGEGTPSTVAEPVVTQEPTIVPEPQAENKNVYVKNQGIPENLGIGVAKFALGELVTEEAYFEYLGKNVCENIVLPEGFSNQSSKEHVLTLAEGEEFNDRWTFYFANDEGTIFMTTTKALGNVESVISGEERIMSNISGCDVVIFEEELERIACFVSGDIGYTVSSYSVSDEDFEKFLTSLIK